MLVNGAAQMITAILLTAFLSQDKIVWNIYDEGHGETNAVCQYMPSTEDVVCYANRNLADSEYSEVFQYALSQYEMRTI